MRVRVHEPSDEELMQRTPNAAIERVEGIHAGPSQRRDVVHARPVHPLHREHRGGGELGEDPRRADVPQATVRVVKKAVF